MRQIVLAASLLLVGIPLLAQEVSVELVLETDQVYVGEQFTAQIRVEGSANPREPDVSALTDFDVRSYGGQTNNTEFVSVVNGKVTRSSSLGYVFTYQLAARKAGTLLIPRIEVRVGDRILSTEPKRVVATKPAEADGFRLAADLSASRAYVGQGLTLTVTWFITDQVRNVAFSVPFLANDAFRFAEPELQTTPGGRYSKASVNDGEAIVELGETTVEGREYTTVRFTRIVTPLRPGTFEVPQASVQFEARVGRQRQRSLIDSFFDTSGGDYRTFTVSSRPSTLRVVDLPAQDRPPRFAGHVGRYSLRASASPAEATVGDPIALTLTLSGPPNVAEAPPPDLVGQRIGRDFALQGGLPQAAPASRAPGSRVAQKSYVYTIRALRAGVTEIPPVELPYFDPQSARYEVARSEPVPVSIVKARVVTSRDAEGASTPPPQAAAAAPEDSAEQGVVHNYEGADALRPQHRAMGGLVRRPVVLALLLLSLLSVAASAAMTEGRRLLAAWRQRGREAFRRLGREMEEHAGPRAEADPAASLAAILSSLNGYFARRLSLPPGAGTFADVRAALSRHGASEEAVAELADVYRICEAGRYARYSIDPQTVRELARRSVSACTAVEERLESGARKPGGPGRRAGALLLVAALAGLAARPADAQGRGAALELWNAANATFRSANEAAAGNGAKARELYARAAAQYEELVASAGFESSKIYYNLGNAYYRLGDTGRAILAYRRAELLDPADANLRHNLTQARLDREDRIESAAIVPLRRVLFFWHYDLSAGTRVLLFALLFAGVAGLLSAWLFLRRPVFLRLAAGLAAPALLFLGSLVVEEVKLARRPEGVILAAEVVARRGDGDIFQPAFQRPLHAGTEFRLIEERHSWYQIEIGDGRRCWIPARSAELLVERRARGPA